MLERAKPLSSLTVEDANAYRAFLAAPPAAWCGPRHRQRWSPLWRPLEGPLSAIALRQAIVVLGGLYGFLVSQNYVIGNPFAAVARPALGRRGLGSQRTLTFTQWDWIRDGLDTLVNDEPARRLARAVRWLYATGLRLAEIVSVRCGDLEKVDYRRPDGTQRSGWMVTVLGKGERLRQVPVPPELVEEMGDELERQGRPGDALAEENRAVFVLARFGNRAGEGADGAAPPAWSASGLYKALKRYLDNCAKRLEVESPADAAQLRRASTHWLRHYLPFLTMSCTLPTAAWHVGLRSRSAT